MGAANFSCIEIDRARKVVDILAVEAPRYSYVSVDPIAAARIVIYRNVSDVDVLSTEAGDRLFSNGSPANVEGLVVRHAPFPAIAVTIWRPTVGPESLVIAICAVELAIVAWARAGTTVIKTARTTVINRARTTATLESS